FESTKLPARSENTGSRRKVSANRKNGTTPSQAGVKRRPERADGALRAVGVAGAIVNALPSTSVLCPESLGQGAGGWVLSGPTPTTDAQEPWMSVFDLV